MDSIQTRSIPELQSGIVIDHIPLGMGLKVAGLLQEKVVGHSLTLGLNFTSASIGKKDFIKVANCVLSNDELDTIALFAPKATINIIEDYRVTSKRSLNYPKKIEGLFCCHNANCITRSEKVSSLFYVDVDLMPVELVCHYCEKSFSLSEFEDQIRRV